MNLQFRILGKTFSNSKSKYRRRPDNLRTSYDRIAGLLDFAGTLPRRMRTGIWSEGIGARPRPYAQFCMPCGKAQLAEHQSVDQFPLVRTGAADSKAQIDNNLGLAVENIPVSLIDPATGVLSYRLWVVKESSFLRNGENWGNGKCLDNGESRLSGILTRFSFRESRGK